MEALKQKIIDEGEIIGDNILKVDNFLNHQLDVSFLNKVGLEFYEHFKDLGVTKILTIEASGIAVACLTAQYFELPVVFAKKSEAKNLDSDTYESEVHSFTRGLTYKIRVAKKYINPGDKVLIIDDFLANGRAVLGLKDIIQQAGAALVGVGIVIEKGFQNGGQMLRDKGVNLVSLAIIDAMQEGQLIFR